MTPGEIKSVLIRALARKPSMNRDELVVVARAVFGKEATDLIVRETLADMVDSGLLTKQVDADDVLPPSFELTTHGQHKAKQLG